MIVVTNRKGETFTVNPDLIETMRETPDTTIFMLNGTVYVVSEPMYDVIDLIRDYRASVLRVARDLPVIVPNGHPTLSAVPSPPAGK